MRAAEGFELNDQLYLTRRVWREQPFLFSASVALFGLVGLLEGAAVVSIAPLLELVQSPGGASSSRDVITRAILFALASLHIPFNLATCLLTTFLLFAASQLATLAQTTVLAHSITKFEAELRLSLYEALTAADWSFFMAHKATDQVTALVPFTLRAREGYRTLVQFLGTGIIVTIYLALALAISWPMTLIIGVGAAVILFLLRERVTRGTQIGGSLDDAEQAMVSEASDHLHAGKTVKAYGMQAATVADFTEPSDSFERLQFRLEFNQGILRYLYESISVAAVFLGIYFAVASFGISVAMLVAFLVIFYRLSPRISALQSLQTFVLSYVPSLRTIDELTADARAAREVSGHTVLGPLRDGISFEHVDFAYVDDHPVLRDVSLTIDRGRTVAIVGPSGSGKTTVVDILLGLLIPIGGCVRIDDVSLADIDVAAWRAQVGYVAQEPTLFHGSVRENIAFGKPDASDAEIERAAQLAFADEFIARLPERYETRVGDRGVRLSGGQRQRIALARALVRRPQILVLDEATSSLDPESEERIQEAVKRLSGSITVVIVAHRLATVRDADTIYFLESGRVVECGSWDALVASHGRFAEMQSLQNLER